MDKLAARKWVDALRSGEYKQAQGYLGVYRSDDETKSFCCLGVFCDMVVQDGSRLIQETVRGDNIIAFDSKDGTESGVLPKVVAEEYGFASTHPEYSFSVTDFGDVYDERGREVELSLPSLNDSGFTFSQIADIIEWVELSNE